MKTKLFWIILAVIFTPIVSLSSDNQKVLPALLGVAWLIAAIFCMFTDIISSEFWRHVVIFMFSILAGGALSVAAKVVVDEDEQGLI